MDAETQRRLTIEQKPLGHYRNTRRAPGLHHWNPDCRTTFVVDGTVNPLLPAVERAVAGVGINDQNLENQLVGGSEVGGAFEFSGNGSGYVQPADLLWDSLPKITRERLSEKGRFVAVMPLAEQPPSADGPEIVSKDNVTTTAIAMGVVIYALAMLSKF